MTATKPEWFQFLGIRVNRLSVQELNHLVSDAIRLERKMVVAGQNLHSLYVTQRDPAMSRFFDRYVDFVHIDGMGIVVLGRLLGHPLRRVDRVTHLDWIHSLFDLAATNHWRLFYVGRRASICEGLLEVTRQTWPNLEFRAALYDPVADLDPKLSEAMVDSISTYHPNLILVGLGNPRQERWIMDHYDRIGNGVFLTCGAAMDYLVGAVPSPPRWAGRLGFEWLFRLLSEPQHLWRRYLVEPWHVLWLLLLEVKTRRLSSKRGV